MKYKKFIFIPVLIILYVLFVNEFVSLPIPSFLPKNYTKNEGILEIPIGDTITVYVTRPYLFGLVRLPIQINDLKLGWMHDIFFNFFIPSIFLIFIFIEFVNSKGGLKMVDWKRIGKSLLIWIVTGIVLYIISGSDSSIGIGFLVAYLEYKLSKEGKQ